jgi:hypothetical protein
MLYSQRGGGFRRPAGSGSIRMRKSSTTEKWSCQSLRLWTTSAIRVATAVEEVATKRKSTTPQDAERPRRKTSSPKSLSKVSSTRLSDKARARCASSLAPGESMRAQATSWPRLRSNSTASPGIFSFARMRTREPFRRSMDIPVHLSNGLGHKPSRQGCLRGWCLGNSEVSQFRSNLEQAGPR